jgi:hypothetical protein
VYVIWDRSAGNSIPAWFSRSTDGVLTWEPPRIIFDPGVGGSATVHQIQLTPDGTLVDVFVLGYNHNSRQMPGTWVDVIRSQDHGATWSAPVLVATDRGIGTGDVKTRLSLGTGGGIPGVAFDHESGVIYLAWSDSRFSGGMRDGIALSKSLDGCLTWSLPVLVNQAPNIQAFTPAVAVGLGGRLAVTYYDFRQDTADPSVLLTHYWRVAFDGRRRRVDGNTGRRTVQQAECATCGRCALPGRLSGRGGNRQPVGCVFHGCRRRGWPSASPSQVFASSWELPGDTHSSQRMKVNPVPQPVRPGKKLEPKKK